MELLCTIASVAGQTPESSFHQLYAQHLRGLLFSGTLTLGAFLLAVHTFIVINLKKELYDHKRYQERVLARRQLAKANQSAGGISRFGPLRRLSRLILAAVVITLSAAVLQISLGFVPNWWVAVVCVGAAAISIAMVFVVVIFVALNLRDWFDFMESEGETVDSTSQIPH